MQSKSSQKTDQLFSDLADYVIDYRPAEKSLVQAYVCLEDAFSCLLLANQDEDCRRMTTPIFTQPTQTGCPIPGTDQRLPLLDAVFSLCARIRWLDYNDTWLAKEWGHPSDNFGGLLALGYWLNKTKKNHSLLTVKDILSWAVKAYEIQGVLSLNHSFNKLGLDHVILVKLASCAVASGLLGATKQQVCQALSQAIIDGHPLRTYRHHPNTGPRKSWAAADAVRRGIYLAGLTINGEPGYPTALSAEKWGFESIYLAGIPMRLVAPLGDMVMQNILFKPAYPAEFHGQTAVEAALKLYPFVKDRLADIDQIIIQTQEPAMRIINKTGPLSNPADRDHCLQYMVAIALIDGTISHKSYQDQQAQNPLIDALRAKITLTENPQFTADYYAADKRAIANSIEILFLDQSTPVVATVHYPIGHPKRRHAASPILRSKLQLALEMTYPQEKSTILFNEHLPYAMASARPIHTWLDQWALPRSR